MAEELDRDSPLFNDEVQVQVKFPDHDKTFSLTVRVLQGSRVAPVGSGGGQREGVLHIEITDELDPFFLYTLQVGEDDYHQLKHDQCLRVDFNSFPRKFIELLESCRGTSRAGGDGGTLSGGSGGGLADPTSRSESLASSVNINSHNRPSFLARLETQVPGGFSMFSLVETNPFKELTHLSLKFRAGNDAAIKTYLAARLRQLKTEVALTSETLHETRACLAKEEASRAQVEQEASALRVDRERDMRDLRAAHSAELTSLREDGVRRAEEAAAVRDAEMRGLRRKAEADVAEIAKRLRESEQRREELMDLKFAHEAELRDLRGRSEAGEAGREAASSDAKALREANRALEARVFKAERDAERLRLQGAALTQQLADAKEMVEKSQALQAASGASVARLEDTQEAYKGSVVALQERLEASVREINRGNAIIQKLQGQYRALRTKAKLKSEVIKQQERLLTEQEASASASESKLKAAAAELRAAEGRSEGLQRELLAAESRLEESARELASNHQVIKWLNKELNDAKLVPGGAISATAAAAMKAVGAAYGEVASSPLRENINSFNLGGVDGNGRRGFYMEQQSRDPGVGGRHTTNAFTAGLRESLAGGVSWDLRGETADGDLSDAFEYRAESPQNTAVRGVEKTPDYARRGKDSGDVRRAGPNGNIVTPESGGVAPDSRQTPSKLMHGHNHDLGDDRSHADYVMGGITEAGATHGIPAF